MLELKRAKEFQEVLNGDPVGRGIGWSYWLVALSLNTAYGSVAIWMMLDQFSAGIRFALILCCAGLPWVFYGDWLNRRADMNQKALRTRLLLRNWRQEMQPAKTLLQPPAFFLFRSSLPA